MRLPRRPTPLVTSLLLAAATASAAAPARSAVPTWGRNGSVTVPSVTAWGLGQDAHGRVLVLGIAGIRGVVVALTASGSPDLTFGQKGFDYWPAAAYLGWDFSASLPNGTTVVAGSTKLGQPDSESQLALAEIDKNGRPVATFAKNGLYLAAQRSCLRGASGMATFRGRIVVAVVQQCRSSSAQTIAVMELKSNGAVDANFGHAGLAVVGRLPLTPSITTPLVIVGDHVFVALPIAGGQVEVAALGPSGKPEAGFGKHGDAVVKVAGDSSATVSVSALLIAKLQRLTVAGCTLGGSFMARFNRNGTPYHFWRGSPHFGFTNVELFGGAFGSLCASFAQLPNFKLVAAGGALVRLYPTGYLDPFHALVALPVFNPQGSPTHYLLVGSDGRLFVATSIRNGVVIGAYHF